ncbi:MAG: hypothetical protein ABFD15_07540 [Methanofastidiosum sp.]
MPLLPTGETEKKHPKPTPKSAGSEEYMKLPRLLPPKDFEETNPESERLQRIKLILVLIIFIIFIVFLHLNRIST